MDRIGPFVYIEHPAAPPPLDAGRDLRRHRVAIAGGGPVGLATALALASWGVPSVVIEADTTVCEGSRAICISRRSLEILGELGALDAHLARGLPWQGGRSFHGTDEILRFGMPHDALQRLPPMINLQQYWIEQYLVEAAAAHPGLIEIRWGSELVRAEADGEGVAMTVRCGGVDYAMDADWLVACDGGQSPVRRSMGLKLGVLSNTMWPRSHHEEVFMRDDLIDLIDGAAYTSEMPVAKPHEEAFTSIAAVLGVRPAECVFVGDRLWDDILGSQQAGMRAILIPHSVLPSIQVPDDSAVPDAVAQRLSDVLTIVRAWHDGPPSTA